MKVFKSILVLTCVLFGITKAQLEQTYIKTYQFKVVEQRIGVREDIGVYASKEPMPYDEILQDALKNGHLERTSSSPKMEGVMKWISQDPNQMVLDVVFEEVTGIDGKEQEPYVANVSIDREKSAIMVSIQGDLAEKKTIEPYSRVIMLLNDLMLLNQEDGFELKKKEQYVRPEYSDELDESLEHHRDLSFHCKMLKTAIFEKRPWELPRLIGPKPNTMKATLTTQKDGQTIASINYFDCDRSHLNSSQYEYDLENRIATKATVVHVSSSMLKNETDINEIVKKYLGDSNLEDYGVLGSRTVRTVILE